MPDQEVVVNTGNQMTINNDLSNIFLWNRRSLKGEVNNGDLYDPLVLAIGTVMGRVAETGKLKAFTSAAVDGSQYPIGILCRAYTIEEGDTQEVYICDDGDVAEEKVVFADESDTLDTVVSDRQVRDHLKTYGIKLITSTELSGYDNA